jgi:hypothetical protein
MEFVAIDPATGETISEYEHTSAKAGLLERVRCARRPATAGSLHVRDVQPGSGAVQGMSPRGRRARRAICPTSSC